MLPKWYSGKTGESYPNLECGPGDKPAWIPYAESRAGDFTIEFQRGTFHIYLSHNVAVIKTLFGETMLSRELNCIITDSDEFEERGIDLAP